MRSGTNWSEWVREVKTATLLHTPRVDPYTQRFQFSLQLRNSELVRMCCCHTSYHWKPPKFWKKVKSRMLHLPQAGVWVSVGMLGHPLKNLMFWEWVERHSWSKLSIQT